MSAYNLSIILSSRRCIFTLAISFVQAIVFLLFTVVVSLEKVYSAKPHILYTILLYVFKSPKENIFYYTFDQFLQNTSCYQLITHWNSCSFIQPKPINQSVYFPASISYKRVWYDTIQYNTRHCIHTTHHSCFVCLLTCPLVTASAKIMQHTLSLFVHSGHFVLPYFFICLQFHRAKLLPASLAPWWTHTKTWETKWNIWSIG